MKSLEQKFENGNTAHAKSMALNRFSLRINPSGIGLDLYEENNYLATYLSYNELICDLSFHYSTIDFERFLHMFTFCNANVDKPFKYRGVCSELFDPLDKVSRYVYYSNSIQHILEKFEKHEKRALSYPEDFIFGVQGMGIHLFDENEKKYRFWIGGSDIHSIADVISEAHNNGKFVPPDVISELMELKRVNVFISHKSQDFAKAKKLYDYLISNGISTFLSEISLPMLSNADYSFEIDSALEKAENIIVIATSKENVMSGWMRYEWNTFANEKRSGRKNGNIVTLLDEGMSMSELPILLKQYQILPLSEYHSVKQFLVF